MSMAESRGLVAPAPTPVRLNAVCMRFCRDVGRRRAIKKYAGHAGWKGGLTKDAVEVGTIGECAVYRWLLDNIGTTQHGLIWNPDADMPKGDGGVDVTCARITIDVKSTAKSADRAPDLMIRQVDERGRILPWTCKAFVYVADCGIAVPKVLGFIWRDDVLKDENHYFDKSPVPGREHWNVNVYRHVLQPMGELLKAAQSNLLARGIECR